MHDAILCMMQYRAWCNIMHDLILCMMQYYAWCNIMVDAISCMIQHYAWCNIMNYAILCMMLYYAWCNIMHDATRRNFKFLQSLICKLGWGCSLTDCIYAIIHNKLVDMGRHFWQNYYSLETHFMSGFQNYLTFLQNYTFISYSYLVIK